MIHREIEKLRESLISEAFLAEKMIEKSIQGFLSKNIEMLKKVMEEDETKVNESELEIDKMCTRIIARFQPEARDLRTVLTIMKINNDLERIADLTTKIAESAIILINESYSVDKKFLDDIEQMAKDTISMISDSLTSFMDEDTVLAQDVCKRDDIVDDMRLKVIKEFVKQMKDDQKMISTGLQFMRISHKLERIADLATNISEETVFMCSGEVVKHPNN